MRVCMRVVTLTFGQREFLFLFLFLYLLLSTRVRLSIYPYYLSICIDDGRLAG